MDPEGQGGFINQAWLKCSEVIHARWAMLGAAGALIAQHQLSAMLGSSSGLLRNLRKEAVQCGRDMWCSVETSGPQWRHVGLGADFKTL